MPGRKLNSLLGLGVHKCPAGSFIDQVGDKITFLDIVWNSIIFVDNATGMDSWLTVAMADGIDVPSDIEGHIQATGP